VVIEHVLIDGGRALESVGFCPQAFGLDAGMVEADDVFGRLARDVVLGKDFMRSDR
jgi:hypothetical protein